MTYIKEIEEVLAVLNDHGFTDVCAIDDARADGVAYGCFTCGSIYAVTASNETERVQQRDSIQWDGCCAGDTFYL